MSNLNRAIELLVNFTIADSDTQRASIVEELKALVRDKSSVASPEETLENIVESMLLDIGVPCSLMGFDYAVYAVCTLVHDPSVKASVTKALYPAVAKHFGTTPSRVERDIRHAIEVAWVRSDADVLYQHFGNTVSADKGKPTNSEFLCLLAKKAQHKGVTR